MMSPAPSSWSDGARLRLAPAEIRQYSKLRPRLVSSLRRCATTSCLVMPGRHAENVACIAATTRSDASLSSESSEADLRARSRSSAIVASTSLLSGKAECKRHGALAGLRVLRRQHDPHRLLDERMNCESFAVSERWPDEGHVNRTVPPSPA